VGNSIIKEPVELTGSDFGGIMKKPLFFLIFIILSIDSYSQSLKFIHRSEFFKDESYTLNNILAIKDSIIISRTSNDSRIENDTFWIVFNQKNKAWSYLTKDDLKKMINDSAFSDTTEAFNLKLITDNEEIWAETRWGILKVINNSYEYYNSVWNSKSQKYNDIIDIADIKLSLDNKIRAIIFNKDTVAQSQAYKSLSIYRNNRFETIDYPTADWGFYTPNRHFVCDYNGRIYHTNADTLYIIENDEVIRKICIQEFQYGAGFYAKLAATKSNIIYNLSNIMYLHVINGEKMTTDTFIRYNERLINPSIDKGGDFFSMLLDSNDNLWLKGMYSCVIYKLNTSGEWTIYPIKNPTNVPDSANCSCYDMTIDKYGKLWMAGGFGLYIFDPNGTSPVEEPPQKIESGALPDVWLYNLYPNPADGSTTIEFFLARAQKQTLNASVCSILGERTLNITPLLEYDDYNQRGKITFSTDGLAGGAYFVLVSAGDTKKLKLLMVAK
jgi:hypothetical protein